MREWRTCWRCLLAVHETRSRKSAKAGETDVSKVGNAVSWSWRNSRKSKQRGKSTGWQLRNRLDKNDVWNRASGCMGFQIWAWLSVASWLIVENKLFWFVVSWLLTMDGFIFKNSWHAISWRPDGRNFIDQGLGCLLEIAWWHRRNKSINQNERRYWRKSQMKLKVIREDNQSDAGSFRYSRCTVAD